MVSKQVQSQTRQPKRSHFIKLHIKVQLLKVLFDTGFSFGTFIDASTASKLIFYEIGTEHYFQGQLTHISASR